MERSFDLKDALRSGVSPDQMLADFQKQLSEAQVEVANEQAAASSALDEARAEMISAIVDYTVALGIVPDDIDVDEMKDDLVETVRETEKELMAVRPMFDFLRLLKGAVEDDDEDDNEARTPDDVIGDFLKSLR